MCAMPTNSIHAERSSLGMTLRSASTAVQTCWTTREVARHVVIGASTGAALVELAEREGASLVVFGSDYRTAPDRVEPGTSAQYLLDGGPVAVAIAPAGLRAGLDDAITSIAVPVAGPRNEDARETAAALAAKVGATLPESGAEPVDLIVVGSQPEAPTGHVVIG